jgi:hypothetical protein
VSAARKRRTATAQPTTAGARVGRHEVENLARRRRVQRCVLEHSRVVHASDKRREFHGAIGRVGGDGIAGNGDRCRVSVEPVQGSGVELDHNDVAAAAQQALDHRTSHAAATACDDVRQGRITCRHRANVMAQHTARRRSL